MCKNVQRDKKNVAFRIKNYHRWRGNGLLLFQGAQKRLAIIKHACAKRFSLYMVKHFSYTP
jgi:hypothetical protein